MVSIKSNSGKTEVKLNGRGEEVLVELMSSISGITSSINEKIVNGNVYDALLLSISATFAPFVNDDENVHAIIFEIAKLAAMSFKIFMEDKEE